MNEKTLIELKTRAYQLKFRVIGATNGNRSIVASFESYLQAESYIWNFPWKAGGPYELWLEKVWVKKSSL